MYTPGSRSIWVVNKDTGMYICSLESVLVEDTRLDIMKHFVGTHKKCILDENETNRVLALISDLHPKLVQINSDDLAQLQNLYNRATFDAIIASDDDDDFQPGPLSGVEMDLSAEILEGPLTSDDVQRILQEISAKY